MNLKSKFVNWVYPELLLELTTLKNLICNLKTQITVLTTKLQYSEKRNKRLDELLADKNVTCSQAQRIHVTDHAIHQYKARLPKKARPNMGSNEDIRKKIYNMVVKHLHTMDKLEDGSYDIDRNMVCRIKDNTVVTCIPRRGYKP